MNVLLVDDEEDIRNFVQAFLTDMFGNAQFDFAGHGGEGIIRTMSKKYDLIITDHKMPFKKGVDMVIEIKSSGQNPNRKTPVIVLSGFLDDEIRQFLKTHKVTFTDKPIDFEILTKEIKALGL